MTENDVKAAIRVLIEEIRELRLRVLGQDYLTNIKLDRLEAMLDGIEGGEE